MTTFNVTEEVDIDYNEVIRSINEFYNMIYEDGITLDQIEEMLLYDISIFRDNELLKEQYERNINLVNYYIKHFKSNFSEENQKRMLIPYELEVIKLKKSHIKTKRSAKSKKVALQLIRANQEYIENKEIENYFNE